VAIGRHQLHLVDYGRQFWKNGRAHQGFVNRRSLGGLGLQTHAAGQVSLGIDIDKEHGPVRQRQRGGQIDRGRGLSNASLLIGDG
jgi:hypothetical protein